jgi:aminoglycoside phosphotransferase (APT) family kinase protein
MAAAVPPADALNAPPAWALARVPGLAEGARALRVERLGGGTVNDVYRIDSSAGRFVLRLDGAAWRRPGVDRVRELALHRTAAAAGIAPALVDAEPQLHGLLIMEYREGRPWDRADYANVDALRRLGEQLYALHRLPAPPIDAFDPWQVALAYVRQIDALPDGALEAASVVHGDLWQGNLLQGSQLWLLDWEYAQLTDPLMDLACVLAYYPVAGRHRAELAAAAGIEARALHRQLADRVFVYRALAWLWHLARGEPGAPP